jgi:hypothetical protein
VRGELADHDGIVQRGDLPQPAPALAHAKTSSASDRCINAAQLQAREPLFAVAPAASGAVEAVGSAATRPVRDHAREPPKI